MTEEGDLFELNQATLETVIKDAFTAGLSDEDWEEVKTNILGELHGRKKREDVEE